MTLAPQIIKYPTQIEKEESAAYYRNKGFPGAIGNIYMCICVCFLLSLYVCMRLNLY